MVSYLYHGGAIITTDEDESMIRKKFLKSAIGAEIKNVELIYQNGVNDPSLQKIGSVKLIFPKPKED